MWSAAQRSGEVVMKIKTSELEGAELDWAVAKAVGRSILLNKSTALIPESIDEQELRFISASSVLATDDARTLYEYKPSTDWSQGGPLIDKYRLCFTSSLVEDGGLYANFIITGGYGPQSWGATCLIAAMRAIVASELGDEVYVPEELAP